MSPVFSIDGAPVECERGQTIAAAAAAGGATRFAGGSVFCGIGVCFECRVTLNGVPGVRACVVEAFDGDVVTSDETRTRRGL